MNNLILAIAMMFPFLSHSQNTNSLPQNENGKVHFAKVIESNNLNQEQTHRKAKLFFINNFNSGKDVIQLDDKDNGVIIGKGNTTINIKSAKYNLPVSMSFTIKIESKDNRCKVDISNIIYNNESPAELFFNESSDHNYNKANANSKIIMNSYRDQTLEKIAFIEGKIKEEFYKKDNSW